MKRISFDKITEVISYIDQGLTIRQACKRVGINSVTFYKYLTPKMKRKVDELRLSHSSGMCARLRIGIGNTNK